VNLDLRQVIPIVISGIGAVGLLLAVLYGIEAAIWAAAYVWLGALPSPNDAILYSLDSMTTRGASGLRLEPHWRIMGALEAANGMLLFGITNPSVKYVTLLSPNPLVSLGCAKLSCYLFATRVSKCRLPSRRDRSLG